MCAREHDLVCRLSRMCREDALCIAMHKDYWYEATSRMAYLVTRISTHYESASYPQEHWGADKEVVGGHVEE